MKQLKENTGIRNKPVIQLNTSIHSNNTLSTPKNIMIEKNSKNRNYRNTINLNNLHNTINLLTTNTQMFNSVISTNVKTPKSLNDYENSLNLINFKLNCDILQNKINRLNSLIPSLIMNLIITPHRIPKELEQQQQKISANFIIEEMILKFQMTNLQPMTI